MSAYGRADSDRLPEEFRNSSGSPHGLSALVRL